MDNEKYFINLNERPETDSAFTKVGAVINSDKEEVMAIYYDKYGKELKGRVCVTGYTKEGEGDCYICFIGDVFYERYFNRDKYRVLFPIFHELGHVLNGDKLDSNNKSDSQIRTEYLSKGLVIPRELKADEFALKQMKFTLENLAITYINDSIKRRRDYEGIDTNRELAIKEFELRKKHIIELCQEM